MPFHSLTRRNFLQKSALAGLSAGMLASGAAPSFSLPGKKRFTIRGQKKALVFIMLDGGNDSYNMLVPLSKSDFRQYQSTRSNLALDEQQLLPLDGFSDAKKRVFGLHEAMPEIQQLFNKEQLSFVANVGPLIEPVTKQNFYNGARLPLGLLSHADQFKHWQTSRPDMRLNSGWFGYFADQLQPDRKMSQIPMNISLAGNNIQQNGEATSPYAITQKGSVGLIVNEEDSPLNQALLNSFEGLLNEDYSGDPFKQAYLGQTREAQSQHEVFASATRKINVPGSFSDTPLSQQLKMVAQSIKAADQLGLEQQTFFLRYIGWDHHDELLDTQAKMLRVLSRAMGEFQTAINDMGLAEQVTTFTGSDFGRTLTSNGNGTDHGWGGHTIVMGSAVKGGQIFGDYPELGLASDNPLDVGDGVLIPTLSTDQLYADIAHWFGVAPGDLSSLFPNLGNFVDTQSNPLLGLFK